MGPGTELKKILGMLGIHPTEDCPCILHAQQMDEWGVQGCLSNRDTIIQWLREGEADWGWRARIRYALRFIPAGLPWRICWQDPYPCLVDTAIQRAAFQSMGS